ncbi:nuclear transport factor 2 family protein [Dyella subtropica]|uniref:nuclear transport factor 2 family protein n=1 Tax=Dyella subtropica TaxID=2992127 RepID=UPI00225AC244|nr:nuclear transport factor 2 family protein [Dyella subtropica]
MKVLMVVTSHSRFGDSDNPTGLYLSELSHPYEVFVKHGLQVDIASPAGGKAPIDPSSISDASIGWGIPLVGHTLKLGDIDAGEYAALFIVGGHGAIYDLPHDADLQRLLKQFAAEDKAISAVCHGQAGLLEATLADGAHLLAGKSVTGFSNAEETIIGLEKVVPFLLEDELVKRGAHFKSAAAWESHVVTHGALMTGQNPASAAALAEAVCAHLEQRHGRLHGDGSAQAIALAKRYGEAWNNRDFALFGQIFADDVTYFDPFVGETPIQIKAMGDYVGQLIAAFPDLRFEVLSLRGGNDYAVFEWIMHGTNTGESELHAATSHTIALKGIDYLEIKGGRIQAIRAYFDRHEYLDSLGLGAASASSETPSYAR